MITTDIIDVAHWEIGANIAEAARQGLKALWAKTGQGVDAPDPSFAAFRDAARVAGILFGDYHFGTSVHSGVDQANDYIKRFDPSALHALDWETDPNHGTTMTLAQAEDFVTRVHEVTGRWPVLYSGLSFLFEHKIPATSPLGHCPLWLACYGEEPKHIPSPWARWDLWQYTDFHDGPHDAVTYPRITQGLGRKVDRSAFRGDADALKAWWQTAGRC